jgi:hypothetical protein
LILALSRRSHGAVNAVTHALDDGSLLVFELLDETPEDALIAVAVELDPGVEWLLRLDRVDFPPGGVAYRHTHPGPGIRCLVLGRIRIESGGETHEYRPFEPWFERGADPVFAAASETEPSAFVRAMLVPRDWAGRRTISYVDPADEEKPKLQRATVFLEQPVTR